MGDWLSFLIFAGFFYFMMRYGCGAHMIHGHKGGQHDHDSNEALKHMDLVCGMEVDAEKGYGLMHKGVLHRFCSRKCLDKFEKEPDHYLLKIDNNGDGS